MNTWNERTMHPAELAGDEPYNVGRMNDIEDYADTIMDECKSFKRAASINSDYDLYDGDLLPKLMVEIAKWDGSSLNAAVQMKAMFNLLADEFQKIAEREVK